MSLSVLLFCPVRLNANLPKVLSIRQCKDNFFLWHLIFWTAVCLSVSPLLWKFVWSQIRDKLDVSSRRAVIPVCLVVYRVRRVDFRGRLLVNCSYSSRRNRVHLVDSPYRVVVLLFDSWLPSSSRRLPRSSRRSSVRLVAAEFDSSTPEVDSSWD